MHGGLLLRVIAYVAKLRAAAEMTFDLGLDSARRIIDTTIFLRQAYIAENGGIDIALHAIES